MEKVNRANFRWPLQSRLGGRIFMSSSAAYRLRQRHENKARSFSQQLALVARVDKRIKVFIGKYIEDYTQAHFLNTSFVENVEQLPKAIGIVNIKRVNDLSEVNLFFHTINQKLENDGLFISCVETKKLRRERLLNKYPFLINRIYYFLDFIIKRVFPKLPVTRRIYMWLTKGRNRVLSRTETLGRLYAAGFELLEQKQIGNNLYFAVKKVRQPLFDYEPLYGMVFKLKRIGKNGKVINVYKMRTMHAYAEYIQAYVYEKNKLDNGGKLKDDFRVSTVGKLLRKYWLDELPMLINLLRGDLKLVGVRPLSAHYLSLYDQQLVEKRTQTKPGLIPPFYADLPKTLEEIMESESKYLRAYSKHPIITDLRYFFLATYNILFKMARSK